MNPSYFVMENMGDGCNQVSYRSGLSWCEGKEGKDIQVYHKLVTFFFHICFTLCDNLHMMFYWIVLIFFGSVHVICIFQAEVLELVLL